MASVCRLYNPSPISNSSRMRGAYYWVWTKHLSLSYFDHPPSARGSSSTYLRLHPPGQTEFAVRLPPPVISPSPASRSSCGGSRTRHRRTPPHPIPRRQPHAREPRDSRAFGILATRPKVRQAGSSAAPPSPPHAGPRGQPTTATLAYWLLFGLLRLMAMLSSTPRRPHRPLRLHRAEGVTTPDRRIHLYRPWFWLAALISAAVFSPVLIWNLQHDFPSFRFQLNHGFSSDNNYASSAASKEYLGGCPSLT